jgi:hypothetical protein
MTLRAMAILITRHDLRKCAEGLSVAAFILYSPARVHGVGKAVIPHEEIALAAGAVRHEPRVVWEGAPPAWVVGIARSMLPRYWR